MTATETLRQLLDERGVEWTANDGEHVKETCWPYMGELTAAFAEYDNGTTRFACDTWCFTPEQAIAATLGTGTCKVKVGSGESAGWWVCSTCGALFDMVGTLRRDRKPRYCPNCGAEVVE